MRTNAPTAVGVLCFKEIRKECLAGIVGLRIRRAQAGERIAGGVRTADHALAFGQAILAVGEILERELGLRLDDFYIHRKSKLLCATECH